jgi:hypothetical protein
MINCVVGTTVYTDIKFNAGDNHNVPMTFTDSNGAAIDLTNAEIFYIAKRYLSLTNGENDVISIVVNTFANPTLGQAVIPFVPSDTEDLRGKFYQGIKLKLASGTEVTVVKGSLILETVSVGSAG